MSERRFYICEEGIFRKWITEAELKRRILMLTGGDYREGDIELLIYGTEKQEPVFGDHLSPERMEEVEADRAKRRADQQATEQEWEKWATEFASDIRHWLFKIPCGKKREE